MTCGWGDMQGTAVWAYTGLSVELPWWLGALGWGLGIVNSAWLQSFFEVHRHRPNSNRFTIFLNREMAWSCKNLLGKCCNRSQRLHEVCCLVGEEQLLSGLEEAGWSSKRNEWVSRSTHSEVTWVFWIMLTRPGIPVYWLLFSLTAWRQTVLTVSS